MWVAANPLLMAQAGNQPVFVPMTEGERFRQYLKDVFNPLSFVDSAASAGIGQWSDLPKEWGQGAEGYGRRYASSYAAHVLGETLLFGASSVLHEDNRYVPSRHYGFGPRIEHALARTFRARDDHGKKRVSVSRIVSFAGTAFISRRWQPASNRNFRSGAINLGTSTAVAFGFNVAREFLPFIFYRR